MLCMDWTSIISELSQSGYTQFDIAARCGCGQTTISELAIGKTKDPRASTAFAIIDLLNDVRAKKAA